MRSIHRPLIIVGLLLVAAACTSGGGGGSDVPPPTVSDAWVRAPMGLEVPGAGYLTITSQADVADWLVAATSPIAADIEIHETTTNADGTTGMGPVDRIEVPAGGTVALEPGGYHLMLLGLTELPAVGDTVELRLTFQEGGEVTVQAEVRAG
jgi:copper(I)-binding protein